MKLLLSFDDLEKLINSVLKKKVRKITKIRMGNMSMEDYDKGLKKILPYLKRFMEIEFE